mgnify:CR=1 FL=1
MPTEPEHPAAFYELDGDLAVPSELTRGPWDPDAQHAGPPAALVGRALESLAAQAEAPMRVGRVTYEILRPIPLAPLAVETRELRGGRRVRLVEARLRSGGDELVRANAWLLREERVELPDGLDGEPPPDLPDDGEPGEFFPTGQAVGYHTGVEYRFIEGSFTRPGPARVWMRMRVPLVAGEEPTPLQRVLVVADSGNGVSATLDWRRYLFINVDLSVHLHRMPAGEWVRLDAITRPDPGGVGLADTALSDERGPIGRAAQTLLVARR